LLLAEISAGRLVSCVCLSCCRVRCGVVCLCPIKGHSSRANTQVGPSTEKYWLDFSRS